MQNEGVVHTKYSWRRQTTIKRHRCATLGRGRRIAQSARLFFYFDKFSIFMRSQTQSAWPISTDCLLLNIDRCHVSRLILQITSFSEFLVSFQDDTDFQRVH